MKKIIKNVSLAMALVAGATLATPAIAQVNVHAASTPSCDVVANYLQIQNFKATANVGEEYEFTTHDVLVPGVGTAAADTVKITLKNPYGAEVELDADNKFTPTIQGKYVATYEVSNGTETATADFEINVKGVSKDITLSLPANSAKIIPAKVATETNGNPTRIELPTAILKDAKGNVLDATAAGLTVSVTATATNDATAVIDDNNLVIDKNIQKSAIYKVRYEARDDTKLVAYKVVEIVAEKDFKAHDYKYNYVGTKPTTAEIGVEKILPGVEAISTKDGSKVNVYYEVEVKHKNITYKATDTNQKVLKVNDDGQYIFTAPAEGDYTITYKINDFTNKVPSTDSTSFIISDVKDNTAPTPMVTLPYSFSEGTDVDAVEVFNEVWTNSDIMLLPIYAADHANGFVDDNLTLYRQIVNNTNKQVVFDESVYDKNQYANKALVFNASGTPSDRTAKMNGEDVTILATDMHQVTEYENDTSFELEDGTYIVKYIAKDKLSGKAEVTLPLTLVIDSNYDKEDVAKAPTVKFSTKTALPSSVNPEDVVKFDAPAATQEKDGNFSDTHLTTQVTYKTSANGTTWVDGTDDIIAYDKDADEYTLTIPSLEAINTAGYKQIKIIASSINDAGKIGTAEKVIKILGTGDESPTTITNVNIDACQNGKVGDQTALPTVEYTDDLAKNVNVEVSIVDKAGNTYTAQNMLYELSGNTITATNAYFVPEAEGEYTITYISTDASNNKTVISFNMVVGANPETFDADFVNLPSTINGGTAEIGQQIDLPSIETYVTSEDYLEASNWRINVEGPSNYATDHETYITFKQIGDYTIKFVCDVTAKIAFEKDGTTYAIGETFKQIESKSYTVKVQDTKGPEILNMTDMEDNFYELTKNGALEKGTKVNLPLPQATDVVWEKSTLAVVGSAVTYETITLDADGIDKITNTTKGIKLAKDAVYKFIYTLYDSNGNSTMIDKFTIDVGDVEAPELVVESGVVKKSYGLNDTVIVDMSKITASDNQDGDNLIYQDEDTGEFKLKKGTLKITAKNNTTAEVFDCDETIKNDKIIVQFSELTAGDYTLIVSLEDSSTKVATNSEITFTVSDAATEAVTGEEVLGVVLIVVSLLMLGGVITYFVVTRKKYNKM
ncbi:MAG: hypothetical protein J6A98_04285 [Clostridia bacterium]|nr:hypothetical protein [Clostridia bacterium]